MTYKRHSTETKKEAVGMYLDGYSLVELSKKYDVTTRQISRWIRAEGHIARPGVPAQEAARAQGIAGYSTLYDADGEVKLQWVKTKTEIENIEKTVAEIIANLNSDIPRIKKVAKPGLSKTEKQFMDSYVFGDPHLNMYAWALETGADWDIKIAVQRHIEGMVDLISNSKPAHTGRLFSLGDLLHNDSLRPVTLAQTAVDVDGRMSMALTETVTLLRICIDMMLKKYALVDVVLARGNHPPTMEIAISQMIAIAYEKEPRLNVIDNTPKHIPLVFGKNFQLITHGDKLSHQKKADIATSKFKKLHGDANFTHILSGHLHHHDSKELSGVQSEIFQVLPTRDAWHTENGFVSADQSACVIRYHPMGGIVDRHYYNPRFYIA